MNQAHCIYEGQDLLGESPLWDASNKKLYWVDALKPALHTLDPVTGQHQEWAMPALIGSIALRAEGGLIAAIGTGFAFIDLPSGEVHMQKRVNNALTPVHLNDGKCDPLGRFWAGEVSHDPANPQGKLYCLHPDGTLQIKKKDLFLFNGPCWSPCHRFFYYTDYLNQRTIFRSNFDVKTAEIGPSEPFIQIPENDPGIPDGCTVDTEGYLWSAKWDGSRITRYSPEGKIDQEFEVPVQRPTSCIFGGEKMDTLFITSASEGAIGKNAGQLFAIQFKKYCGLPEIPFGA